MITTYLDLRRLGTADALAMRQELQRLRLDDLAVTVRADGAPVLLLDAQGAALPVGKALLTIDVEVADRVADAALAGSP